MMSTPMRFFRALLLNLVLLGGWTTASPLVAQQDSAMMKKDSGMMDHEDKMSHDDMGPNLMFMGAQGLKASGDYEVAGSGKAAELKLTDDFAVEQAPDLYLVLASGPSPDRDALYLGKLKSPQGAQSYSLPKNKDLTKFTTLLVWSKKEKRAVASAEWHPAGGWSMEHM